MNYRWLIVMGLFASILSMLGCAESEANSPTLVSSPTSAASPATLEEQLATFKRLGFDLNNGTALSDIDRWDGKAAFEREPYKLPYVTLGQTIEREPWTPLTDRVWDFDTEAIEDHGAYIDILKNLERISRGDLKFDDLKDYVDVEEGKAWVSFSVRGKPYKWNLKVDDDWADPALFSKIVELTKALNTKGRFTYFDTGGQDAVIGYETPESREEIIKATGLRIEWLH